MFWKKKKKEPRSSDFLICMLLLPENTGIDYNPVINYCRNRIDENIKAQASSEASIAFTIDGHDVAMVHMPFPVPESDWMIAADYAYYWPDAKESCEKHQSHLIVTVLPGKADQVSRFMLLSNLVSALFQTTEAIAVYKGAQCLLLERSVYVDNVSLMDEENLPLNLWIYIGLRKIENKNSAYTYGLKEFNKLEMEVINSSEDLEDLHSFLFNISHYVLSADVEFQSGQTCGLSEDQIVPITLSKGVLVEGESFKLGY
jgi:hypothetical protein